MYSKIHTLYKQGFDISKIARKLKLSRTTVYRYLNKTPDEMAIWLASTQKRLKKLDFHREEILSWLEEHPDLSSAQIHDWLKEHHKTLKVGESTVRNYVSSLREDYNIPKVIQRRQYEAIPDPPMGKQAQVDFGTCTVNKGKSVIRLWFITFVLSHSRFKYAEWLDRPFTVKDVVDAHERAFQHFEGIPKELVYDQDILISTGENAGDITLTKEFQQYVTQRNFIIRLCRRADPESKGRVENVVGYVKKNFAKNRAFSNLEKWNEQCMKWLERTGNGNIHNSTKKRPVEVHSLEKEHLQSIPPLNGTLHDAFSITRTVRKDNTIRFQSNRYSVPLDTYKHTEEVVVYLTVTSENQLIIRRSLNGPIIATHNVAQEKGQLIQDRQHTRDRSKGINEWMHILSQSFEEPERALNYLEQVRQNYPRYIRDQLQIVASTIKQYNTPIVSRTLDICITKKLYSANDFKDVAQVLDKRDPSPQQLQKPSVSPLVSSPSILQIKAEKRPVEVYLSILKGTDSSCV